MRLFDNFLDSFSAKELKGRVWGVVIFGLVVSAATAAAGFYFLVSVHTVSIEGTGTWMDPRSKYIEAAFSKKDIELLMISSPAYAKIAASGGMTFRTPVVVEGIDPEEGRVVMKVGTDSASPITIVPGRFNLELVLYQEPYWKLLWGKGGGTHEGN